jgi:hypothetical protein
MSGIPLAHVLAILIRVDTSPAPGRRLWRACCSGWMTSFISARMQNAQPTMQRICRSITVARYDHARRFLAYVPARVRSQPNLPVSHADSHSSASSSVDRPNPLLAAVDAANRAFGVATIQMRLGSLIRSSGTAAYRA